MPMYVWTYLATFFEARCVYAIVFAIYTCPDDTLEMKQCVWVTVGDLRRFCHKDQRELRASAEDFLCSVSGLFEDDGIFVTRVLAVAAVIPGTKGNETLAKVKRSVALACTAIYIQTAVMVGRYVCGKSQDDNFGKDKADNLRDILERLRQLKN